VRCHPFSTSSADACFRTLVLGLDHLREKHRPASVVLHRQPALEFLFKTYPDEHNLNFAIGKGRESYGSPCHEDLWIVVFPVEQESRFPLATARRSAYEDVPRLPLHPESPGSKR
jgi:hypothetical protein